MNENTQKKFPIIRWALCCLLASAWVFLTFDGINGFIEYPATRSDRNLVVSMIFIAYLVISPKNPQLKDSTSVWTRPISSFRLSDVTLSFVSTIVLGCGILVGICAAVWAVGEEGLKRVFDSYVVQLSVWVSFLALITKQSIKWQSK